MHAKQERTIAYASGLLRVSYASPTGGCSSNKQPNLKVICQSAVGVKAITVERSCSQECICSKQMKEKIVHNKHLLEAEDLLYNY